jgi:hypothetical protein
MFRTVFPSIIRSSRLHTATGMCQTGTAVCCKRVAVSVWHMPVAAGTVLNSWRWTERPPKRTLASRWQYLFDIYLLLYVQSWTPDDGRKGRPKHVQCYPKNKINLRSCCILLDLLQKQNVSFEEILKKDSNSIFKSVRWKYGTHNIGEMATERRHTLLLLPL